MRERYCARRLSNRHKRWTTVAALAALLTGAAAASAQSLTWDSGGTSPANPVDGAGTWDTTTPLWSDGTEDVVWPNDTTIAVFGNGNGAAGTITLGTAISAGGLTFNPATSGNYMIAGISTLTLSGATPTITVNGAQASISAPIGGTSGLTVAGTNGGTLTLLGSNSYTGATSISSGTVILASGSVLTGSGVTISSGATVETNGSAQMDSAIINNGTVSMLAPIGGTVSLFASGAFTNNSVFSVAASGSLSATPILNVSSGVTNSSTGTSNVNTNLNISGNLTNNGNLTIASGATLGFINGGNFNQFGGTLTVNGSLEMNFGIFSYTGGNITGNPITLGGMSRLVLGSSVSTGTFTFTDTGTQSLSPASPTFVIPTGVTVKEQPASGSGTLTASGTLTNNGTLSLLAPLGGSVNLSVGNLTNNSAFIVAASGAIAPTPTLSMSGATGVINSSTGAFNVNTNLNISSSGDGSLTNSGTLTIASGATLEFGNIPTFNQMGGTLAVNGSMEMNVGTFSYTGGTITGNSITLNDTSLALGPSVSTGTFVLNTGNGILQGLTLASPNFVIPAGVTVKEQPASGSGTLTTSGNSINNNGTLSLLAPIDGSVNLNLGSGSFTNNSLFVVAAAGSMSATPVLTASSGNGVTNSSSGTFNVNTNLNISGRLTNNGNLTIASGANLGFGSSGGIFDQTGGTLAVNGSLGINVGGTFSFTGGTITGNPITLGNNSELLLGSLVSTGTVTFTGSNQFLDMVSIDAIPAGVTIKEQPLTGSGTLVVQGSPTNNNGTISLLAPVGGSVNLSSNGFINNSVFTVGASGSLSATPVLTGSNGVTNSSTGTFNVNSNLNINSNNGLTNNGNLAIASGSMLGFSGVPAFNQNGGELTIATGGSLTLGTSGQLQISGGNISLAAGTTPANLFATQVIWPNPAMPQNPATDLASITTTTVGAGQTPGQVNFLAAEATFNIADPNATLTCSATLTNGSLDKTGLGTLILSGPQGITGTLNVEAGTLTVASTGSVGVSAIAISSGATLNAAGASNAGLATDTLLNVTGTATIAAASLGSGITPRTVSSITLNNGGLLQIANPPSHADRQVLITSGLTLAGGPTVWQGLLDLSANDMIVHNANSTAAAAELTNITSQLAQGFANNWQGTAGITSTAAVGAGNTALAVELNDDGTGTNTPLMTLFDGQTVGDTDVLVKYTYYGDAMLTGGVTADDYLQIDSAFNFNSNPANAGNLETGWRNGDFNYDGLINGDDYTLIDNAFNSQESTTYIATSVGPAEMLATDTAQIATSVPEPTSSILFALASLAWIRCRRPNQPRNGAYKRIPDPHR